MTPWTFAIDSPSKGNINPIIELCLQLPTQKNTNNLLAKKIKVLYYALHVFVKILHLYFLNSQSVWTLIFIPIKRLLPLWTSLEMLKFKKNPMAISSHSSQLLFSKI